MNMNQSHRTQAFWNITILKCYNVWQAAKVGAMSFMFSDVIWIICVNKCAQSHCLSYYQQRMKRQHHEAICAPPFADWGWENYLNCQNFWAHFSTYGRKSADCTKHENDVIFFVFLATVFGNLEVWKVNNCNIFLIYISAGVQRCLHINLLYSIS